MLGEEEASNTCGCDNMSKLQEQSLPSEEIVIRL